MGAISKSEPIFSKFGRNSFRLDTLPHTKFQSDPIYITVSVGYNIEIGWNIYMGAISKYEPIFSKFGRNSFRLDTISHTKFRSDPIFITTSVGHNIEIGWNIYMGAIS